MSKIDLILLLGATLAVLGIVRLLLTRDRIRRIIALNIASGGVMMLLLGFAQRGTDEPDPIPQALVLTGIVITVAVTGLALALTRRIEAAPHSEDDGGHREGRDLT